jgi:hypothetical protein
MLKKTPFTDKGIDCASLRESLAIRGLRVRGMLSHGFSARIKNAQLREETGRFRA